MNNYYNSVKEMWIIHKAEKSFFVVAYPRYFSTSVNRMIVEIKNIKSLLNKSMNVLQCI